VLSSRIYSALLRYPKFRPAESVPEFIVGTVSIKEPIAVIEYICVIVFRNTTLRYVHYIFDLYRSGIGRYYIRVACSQVDGEHLLGFVFKLGKAEVIAFLSSVLSHVAELYPEEYEHFMRCVKAVLSGSKLDREFLLYSSELMPPDMYTRDLVMLEKLRIRTTL